MDARQRRSRDRLRAAALELADEGSVADLTVTEVARRAGVHRSTFYEHAASPAALVEAGLLAELDGLRDTLLAAEDVPVAVAVTQVTRGVLLHVESHTGLYRRGLADDSGGASLHAMLSQHFRETARLLAQRARVDVRVEVPGVDDEAVAEVARRFLADGTVGAIAAWLARTDPQVDDFMAVYVALLPGWWPRDLSVVDPS